MSDARVLDAPWLRSGPTARVLALLNGNGEEARVIGGAVRNVLLGIPIGDIDIATTALPDEVIRRARAAGIKSVPTGIEHGTVTLVVEASRSRSRRCARTPRPSAARPRWRSAATGSTDAERRDFTINGLSVDAAGLVHDHVGGLADIAARRVRFIGDPDLRIAEDYLRILRFFRIHAAFGAGEPDRAGYLACIAARAGLASLSAERVRMEMMKLMVADGAAGAIAAMADGGLAAVDLRRRRLYRAVCRDDRGGAPDGTGAGSGPKARRARGRRHRGCQAPRGPDAAEQCRGPARWIPWAIAGGGSPEWTRRPRGAGSIGSARSAIATACCWPGRDRAGDGDAAQWQQLATLPERWSAPKFPLKAADFIARGIAQGPALGQVLALAEDAWLAADFPLDEAALKAIADQAVARFTRDAQAVSILSGFADISLLQLLLVAGVALFASIIGGLAGYGTGALDAAGSGAAGRRRTGGADHRHLGDLHQSQPHRRLSALCRPPSRADRDPGGGADDRARRLRLYRLTNAGAALVIGAMLISSVPLRRLPGAATIRIGDTGLGARRGRIRRRGRRHLGLGRDPAVAVDGGGARGRGRDRHRRRDLGRHQPDQDFRVRTGRRGHRAGAGLCAADRRDRAARGIFRARPSSSACRCISTPRSSTSP